MGDRRIENCCWIFVGSVLLLTEQKCRDAITHWPRVYIMGRAELPRLSSRDMDSLRQCVKPSLVGASNERLERIVSESLSALPAATSEDFLSTLGSFGKAGLPALEKAAPSVLQGAAQGGSVGGPYGALIGGGLGLVKGLVQQKAGARAPASPPPALASAPAQTPTATPATSSAGTPPELPLGQGAAATVVGLLQNPIIQQALLSQVPGLKWTYNCAGSVGRGVTPRLDQPPTLPTPGKCRRGPCGIGVN